MKERLKAFDNIDEINTSKRAQALLGTNNIKVSNLREAPKNTPFLMKLDLFRLIVTKNLHGYPLPHLLIWLIYELIDAVALLTVGVLFCAQKILTFFAADIPAKVVFLCIGALTWGKFLTAMGEGVKAHKKNGDPLSPVDSITGLKWLGIFYSKA